MIYKNIKDQIFQQTRTTPKQADFQGFSGAAFNSGKDTNIPGGVEPGGVKLSWDRYSYIRQRAIYAFRKKDGVWGNWLLTKDFIPVLDIDSYNTVHPEVEEPDTVYNYWSYNGNIAIGKTDPSDLGGISELNIKHDSNIAYGVYVPPTRSGANNVELKIGRAHV